MISFAENTSVTPLAGHSQAAMRPSRAALSQGNERDSALDFAKGGLVLCMIAYHTLNYFRYDVRLLRHLHFLPPSFIFIAGFLITHIYLPRTRSCESKTYRRLTVRGLKVLGLFVTLNLSVHAIFTTSYNRNLGLGVFFENLDALFVAGDRRYLVFGILLPISYLLLLSGLFLRLTRTIHYILPIISGGTYLACLFLSNNGQLTFNLDLVSMGLLGMVAGLASKSSIVQFTSNLVPIVTAYVGYSLAVIVWYPTYFINTFGVILALLLLYAIGRRVPPWGLASSFMALLGNYSLFSYLFQIAVLQAIFRSSRNFTMLEGDVLIPFALTVAITIGAIKALDLARLRSPFVAWIYKLVFV